MTPGTASAANGACPAPAADYGKDTVSINLPPSSTYRVWSHLLAPSANADSFMMQLDSSQCFSVGGGTQITPNTWTWVDYSDGNTATPIDLANLAPGSHTLTLVGSSAGVTVDDIIFATDPTCVPTGNGNNCVAAAAGSPSMSPSSSSSGSSTTAVQGTTTKAKGVNWALTAGIGLVVLGLAGGLWYLKRRNANTPGAGLQI